MGARSSKSAWQKLYDIELQSAIKITKRVLETVCVCNLAMSSLPFSQPPVVKTDTKEIGRFVQQQQHDSERSIRPILKVLWKRCESFWFVRRPLLRCLRSADANDDGLLEKQDTHLLVQEAITECRRWCSAMVHQVRDLVGCAVLMTIVQRSFKPTSRLRSHNFRSSIDLLGGEMETKCVILIVRLRNCT